MSTKLDARLRLKTPEQVEVHLPLGGVGSRMAAYGLDLLIRLGLSVLIVIPAAFVFENFPGYRGIALGGAFVAYFFLHFGYYVYHETLHRGQTPGKRRMGLRTVKLNGAQVDFLTSVIRNLTRPVDWMPAFYGVGVAVMFLSRSEQRLGDITAGTVVIRERAVEEGGGVEVGESGQVAAELGIVHPERIQPRLSPQEGRALERLMEHLPGLEPERARELSARMIQRIREGVGDPEGQLRPYLEDPEGWRGAMRLVLARHREREESGGLKWEARR